MSEYSAVASEVLLKSGYMFIKRPHSESKPFRIKAWQSKYFVLKGLNNNCRLEYFKNESACTSTKSGNCISLANGDIFIDEYNSRSHKHSFILCVKGQCPLVLACISNQLKNEWITALKVVTLKHLESPDDTPRSHSPFTNGKISVGTSTVPSYANIEEMSPVESPVAGQKSADVVGEYDVTVRLTPSSEENNIRGSYIMQLTNEMIILLSLDKTCEAISWPIVYVRKFKSDAMERTDHSHRQLLTLEISNKSPRGQGIFQFQSESANKIAALIRAAASQHFFDIRHRREVFTRINTWSEKRPETTQNGEISSPKRRNTLSTNRKFDGKVDPVLGASKDIENPPEAHEICDTWSSPESSLDDLNGLGSQASEDVILSYKSKDNEEENEQKDSVSLGERGELQDEGMGEGRDNPYIDILADEHAEPIHISDRKCSESPTRANVLVSGDSSCLFQGSGIADSESTTELGSQFVKKEQDVANNTKDILQNSGEGIGGGEVRKLPITATDAATRRIYSDLVAQIGSPVEKSQSVYPLKVQSENDQKVVPKVKAKTKLIVTKQLSEEEAREEEKRKDLMEKLNENPKLLLEDVLNQLETPQDHNARDMFPLLGQRNSVGDFSTDQCQEEGVHELPKKILGKSKSDIASLSLKATPPPLPLRVEAPRESVRKSEGELSDKISRFSTHHTPTQVGKSLRSSPLYISPHLSMSVVKTVSLHQNEVSTGNCKVSYQSELPNMAATRTNTGGLSNAEVAFKNEQENIENAPKQTRSKSLVYLPKPLMEKPNDKEKKRKLSRTSKIAKSIWKSVASPPASPSLKKLAEKQCLNPTSLEGKHERGNDHEREKVSEDLGRQSLTPGETKSRSSGSWSDPDVASPKLGKKFADRGETHVFINKKFLIKTPPVSESKKASNVSAESAPLVPPRKKEEPPPLPPRKMKPPQGGGTNTDQNDRLHFDNLFSNSRQRKPHEIRRKSAGEIISLNNGPLPPPPIPPRKECARSPSPRSAPRQQSIPMFHLSGSLITSDMEHSESDHNSYEEHSKRLPQSGSNLEAPEPPCRQRSFSAISSQSDTKLGEDIPTTLESEVFHESHNELKIHHLSQTLQQNEAVSSYEQEPDRTDPSGDTANLSLNDGIHSRSYIDVIPSSPDSESYLGLSSISSSVDPTR